MTSDTNLLQESNSSLVLYAEDVPACQGGRWWELPAIDLGCGLLSMDAGAKNEHVNESGTASQRGAVGNGVEIGEGDEAGGVERDPADGCSGPLVGEPPSVELFNIVRT